MCSRKKTNGCADGCERWSASDISCKAGRGAEVRRERGIYAASACGLRGGCGWAGTGGRWPFVVGLSAVGLLYLYERRLKFAGIRLTVVLGILAFVFSAVGADRGQSIRRLVGTDNTLTINRNSDLKFMEGMDLGNLEYFEYLVYAIPQRTNTYGYFLDTFQVFTEPVPRSLWKNKPIGAPFNKMELGKFILS